MAGKKGALRFWRPPADVPHGYCHCGCGERAPIVKVTDGRRGLKRGDPNRFIRGHSGRLQVKGPTIYGREAARRLYPQMPDVCEGCHERPPRDRHHIDGNYDNNARLNIAFLCRRCHLLADGRMEKFVAAGRGRSAA